MLLLFLHYPNQVRGNCNIRSSRKSLGDLGTWCISETEGCPAYFTLANQFSMGKQYLNEQKIIR